MNDYVTGKELKTELNDFAVKIFKHFDKRFDGMDKKFEDLRSEFRDLQSAVDAYAKQVEIYHHESVARDAQVDRIKSWVEKIAQKTGVKLEY